MSGVASFATGIRLELASPGTCKVVIVRNPVLTVHALITGAIMGTLDAQPRLRLAVVDALGSEGFALYSPMRAGRDRVFYPRAIVPIVDDGSRWPIDAGDAIGDLPAEELVDQLLDMQRLRDGAGWKRVIDDPRPWLTGIAAAITRVSRAVTPWWNQAADRIAVEEARLNLVGTTPTGVRHFVNELSRTVRLDDDALRIKWTEPSHELAGDQIELTPMIVAGPRSYLVLRTPTGTAYGYPMTAGFRGTTHGTSPDKRLDALLGSHRARLLRCLDRPCTYTELADRVGIAISTTSHHVDRLRTSGLVVTMRLGRAHWVLRTAVGDRLLELLD